MSPVSLVEHSEKWARFYNEIKALLEKVLKDLPVCKISCVGSTAIANIWAKNIVNVLVEIPVSCDMEYAAKLLEKNDFIRMSTKSRRISFNRGYTSDGVYHIHLRYIGNNDELFFRDYLNDHPMVAKEYENLKLRLCRQHKYNKDAYTDAKAGFAKKYTQKARELYKNKY